MKQKPELLRDRARKMMEMARKIEEEQLIKIGRLALKYFKNDGPVDIEGFRADLKKLRGGGEQ